MRLSLLIASIFTLLLNPTHSIAEPETKQGDITFIASDSLKKSGTPFSNAVEVDGWVMLAGALGSIPGKGLVEGGIEAETKQAMENIKATLESMGLNLQRVIKCSVMLADMAEWPAFNAVYKEFFNGNYPARSAFAVAGLGLNARVEIECIARR